MSSNVTLTCFFKPYSAFQYLLDVCSFILGSLESRWSRLSKHLRSRKKKRKRQNNGKVHKRRTDEGSLLLCRNTNNAPCWPFDKNLEAGIVGILLFHHGRTVWDKIGRNRSLAVPMKNIWYAIVKQINDNRNVFPFSQVIFLECLQEDVLSSSQAQSFKELMETNVHQIHQ